MPWGGLAAVAGSLIGGYNSARAQKEANKTNVKIAREQQEWSSAQSAEQMAFQERMSNTAHQREVEDLRKAGLNPILSAGGGGASSPTGAMGSAQMPQVEAENELAGIEAAISNATEQRRLKKELEAADSQIKLNKSAEATQETQRILNVNSANKLDAETRKVDEEIKQLKAIYGTIEQNAKTNLKRGKIDEKLVPLDSIIDRVGKTLGAASSAKKLILP